MTPMLIERYQPGGDIWGRLVKKYGSDKAKLVAIAAKTSERWIVAEALAFIRHGRALPEADTVQCN